MKLIFIRSIVPSATPAAENTAWIGPFTCSSAASIEAGSRRSTWIDWATLVVHRRVVQHDDLGTQLGR